MTEAEFRERLVVGTVLEYPGKVGNITIVEVDPQVGQQGGYYRLQWPWGGFTWWTGAGMFAVGMRILQTPTLNWSDCKGEERSFERTPAQAAPPPAEPSPDPWVGKRLRGNISGRVFTVTRKTADGLYACVYDADGGFCDDTHLHPGGLAVCAEYTKTYPVDLPAAPPTPQPPRRVHDFSDPYVVEVSHTYKGGVTAKVVQRACVRCGVAKDNEHVSCEDPGEGNDPRWLADKGIEQVMRQEDARPKMWIRPPVPRPVYAGPSSHGTRSLVGGPVRWVR